jgi:dTDP-glucose 4,6-dehydratase
MVMAQRCWLVTGGCGFIGSNLIRLILAERPDVRVVNVDALTYAGNVANLEGLAADQARRLKLARVDIADAAGVRAVFEAERPEAVLHLAAESHVDRSLTDAAPFIRTNVLGTQVLLAAAMEFGAGRFLMVSTDEVYGSLGKEGYFTETTPLSPRSPYAASKASADLLTQAYVESFGLDAVITRCSNNYGPYQFPEKLIPLVIHHALHDKPIPVYGDGSNVRDWIYVEDHARGLLAALEQGKRGEVYNFGGNSERANLELVKLLLGLLGKPESLIRFVEDRKGHDWRYAIDATKARGELGWSPATTFDTGMERTVAWYRDNRPWWEAIISGDYLKFYDQYYGERLRSAREQNA